MSALLCVLHKSGGSHFRNVTTQAAAIRSNNFWIKQEEEPVHDRKSDQKEIQEIYDGQYQKFLSFGSSLHELYKIDPVRARMGSVSSIVAGVSEIIRPSSKQQDQDGDVVFNDSSPDQLLLQCQQQLQQHDLPTAFSRNWTSSLPQHTSQHTEGNTSNKVRVFQWNMLAQAIGSKLDNFRLSDPRVLDWSSRRWRVLEEILLHHPDVICLQEVDHFSFIDSALKSVGYSGRFMPKPDSACKYVQNNNGPDGVAIFIRSSKFQIIKEDRKVLQAWGSPTNQIALSLTLQNIDTGKQFSVITTHLKARKGALLENIRDQQGADLMKWIKDTNDTESIIVTGDFNAEPTESVIKTVTQDSSLQLHSSYSIPETEFTTWKIRDSGEEKHVLDYIFHTRDLQTSSTLDMPSDDDVGVSRLPSLTYASDHVSLVSDILI